MGEFNAPIAVLKGILADVAKYSEFMPYTKESRVLPQNAQLLYMVLKPPLVGTLDYTIRVHEESLKGVDGGTLLESIGSQTRATYTLYTDGGGIPPLIMNYANKGL